MARINKAKNFAGKSYVVSNEVDSLIKSLKASENEYILTFDGITMDGGTVGSHSLNLQSWFDKVVADISGQALGIEQGKGIVFSTSSSSTNNGGTKDITVIHADVDETTIGFTSDDAAGKITSLLKIKKLDTATTGYAASYQLQDANGGKIGDTIDIVKDQFLKSTSLVWGTAAELGADSKPVGETATKPETSAYPFLKMEFYSNDNGASADDALISTVYIPVNELFRDYTAGNAAISIDNDNKISGVVNETDKIYASKGVETSVLSINAGIKATGIQGAIDLAVTTLKNKTQDALDEMSSQIETFEESIDSALTKMASDVNGAIDTVESNVGKAITSVNTALTNTVNSVNTKIGADIDAVNGAVDTAITAVDNKVDTAVTNVNTKVGAAVTAINTEIGEAVDAVNTALGTTVTTINTEIDDAVDAVNTALGTTVTNVNTQVNTAVEALNGKVDTAVTNVNTALGTTVGNVNTEIGEAVAAVEGAVTTAFASIINMVVEEGIVLTQADANTPATKTITGSKVIAVYDADGYQVYPEIKIDGENTIMTVDFGGAKTETWKVLKTAAVTFTKSDFTANATAGSATAPAAVSYSNATAGSANFTADAAATDATFEANAAYEEVAAIADVAYAAPAKATNATAGSATFTGAATDVTAQDVVADVAAEIAELDYKQA